MKFTINETNKAKGLAICLLIFHHLYRSASHIKTTKTMTKWITETQLISIAGNFRIIVWVFAFLSSYGLAINYAKSDKNFVLKRYFKLMQPFWLTMVIIWLFGLIIPAIGKAYADHQVIYRLLDFFALADLLSTPKVSGVFWYMSFALIQLILFPVLYKGCRRYGWIIVPVSAILLKYLNRGIYSSQGGPYYQYLLIMELGILFAQYGVFEAVSARKRKSYVRILELAFLFSMSFVLAHIRNQVLNEDYSVLRQLCMTISAMCLIFGCFLDIRNKHISSILEDLGGYSGYMFFTHALIIKNAEFMYFSGNVLITWIVCILISLLSAIILKKISQFTGYTSLMNQFSNRICDIFNKTLNIQLQSE